MAGYGRASLLEGLDRIAKREGKNLRPILNRFGWDADIFRAIEIQLDFDDIVECLEICAKDWKLPDIGIKMGKEHSLSTLGVISLAARMESTVRDGLRAILRNLYILSNKGTVSFKELPKDHLMEVYYAIETRHKDHRQFIEMAMVGDQRVLEEISGQITPALNAEVDLSRFSAAPSARLSHLALESDRAFPTQC